MDTKQNIVFRCVFLFVQKHKNKQDLYFSVETQLKRQQIVDVVHQNENAERVALCSGLIVLLWNFLRLKHKS